jgi:hypothetical protein
MRSVKEVKEALTFTIAVNYPGGGSATRTLRCDERTVEPLSDFLKKLHLLDPSPIYTSILVDLAKRQNKAVSTETLRMLLVAETREMVPSPHSPESQNQPSKSGKESCDIS